MTKTDMLFGALLIAVVSVVGLGVVALTFLTDEGGRADRRGEALLAGNSQVEEPASSTSCGCYELAYDLGAKGEGVQSLSYLGNYDLCYQRLSQSGARAFESGYLAGTRQIRGGRFCREGDFE